MEIIDWLLPLLAGIAASLLLNSITPLFPSILLFLAVTISLLIAVFYSIRENVWVLQLRLMFIGASVASILFALHTYFFSIVLYGMVQIQFDSLIGIFRSILIISLFSLLERLTKFLEDQKEQKTRKNIDLCTQQDYVI